MERSKKITLLAVAVAVVLTLVLYGFRDRIVSPAEESGPAVTQTQEGPTAVSPGESSGNLLLDLMNTTSTGTTETGPSQTWLEDLVDILFRLSL
ncbi:MAG TPA: hypothetical protein VK918_04995, partial [Pyrinomonadaceae bacterium]|nr:hypothetical protein [Pyrinomonadaceae bacterium]